MELLIYILAGAGVLTSLGALVIHRDEVSCLFNRFHLFWARFHRMVRSPDEMPSQVLRDHQDEFRSFVHRFHNHPNYHDLEDRILTLTASVQSAALIMAIFAGLAMIVPFVAIVLQTEVLGLVCIGGISVTMFFFSQMIVGRIGALRAILMRQVDETVFMEVELSAPERRAGEELLGESKRVPS